MKILIIHAHWNNRGDEAALRAMVDELSEKYPEAEIGIQIKAVHPMQFPYEQEKNIKLYDFQYPKRKNYLFYPLIYLFKGRITFLRNERQFVDMVKDSDIVLHGPGGPSIGDIYYKDELPYLLRLLLIQRMGISYGFYAPSMGPFRKYNKKWLRNWMRKKVLNNASLFFLREPVSKGYVKEYGIQKDVTVSLDSAFQHPIDMKQNKEKLEQYSDLEKFLNSYDKVVGITITDLLWHPTHKNSGVLVDTIRKSFESFIDYLKKQGIGVVFIPQLFGTQKDAKYMESFMQENCFTITDQYDCYFQQYIISKLYAVVGMRYHSNIFSAKMGTPFISVAYEQKMTGFMKKSELEKYCITVEKLSEEKLISTFEILKSSYNEYRDVLKVKSVQWRDEAHKTTDAVIDFLEKNSYNFEREK